MEDVDGVLPLLPWALAAVATVLVAALSVPPGGGERVAAGARPSPLASLPGALAAAGLALAAVLLGRLGPATEQDNPGPALVLGVGWPLLLLLPGLVGLLRPAAGDAPEPDARPAAAAALAVVAYLTVPVAPGRPATLATAVAAYALVVLAVGLAAGRAAAARVEVLGLVLRWGALGRALPRWAAPRGALAVLAVLLGGVWFERYERSRAWVDDLPGRGQTVVGLLTCVAVAALVAWALHRVTRRGPPGTAAAVLLPLVCGLAVAAVARRALISVQLLADQAAGPRAVDPDPLGVAGGQLLALGLVVVGAALAAAVLARRTGEGADRLPGVGILLAATFACAWVVLQP